MNEPGHWDLHPSLWFDACCLVPLVADVAFYTSRHEQDAAIWQSLLSGDARESARTIGRRVTHDASKPLSAFLALWTSPLAVRGDPATELASLIDTVAHPDPLLHEMAATSRRWSAADEALFRSIQPDLMRLLAGLHDADLVQWWSEHAEPTLTARCSELVTQAPEVDLTSVVARCSGVHLPDTPIEVCLLRWAAPHAIRVTGLRFLADVRYDSLTLFGNAVHELLHPPFPDGHHVWGALDALADEPFLAARFAGRDIDAGYNTWRSYVEEDAAQALDQLLCERLGIARRSARGRWLAADGGMHVLAALLHDELIRVGFDSNTGDYGIAVADIVGQWIRTEADLSTRYTNWIKD